jgi:hypothetical protein
MLTTSSNQTDIAKAIKQLQRLHKKTTWNRRILSTILKIEQFARFCQINPMNHIQDFSENLSVLIIEDKKYSSYGLDIIEI